MKPTALAFILCLSASSWLHADVKADAEKIDALLQSDWAAHQLKPNAPASDEAFVRRVYLDVAGRIPTFPETEAFLNSTKATKRAELIDTLLAGEGYVSHFYNYWSDILRNHTRSLGGLLSTAYGEYLKNSLRANKPYDQIVRELLTAQGKSWENGAVGYYLRDRGMPLDNMANTVRVFLGTRIECAQCHDHPFDQWKQMQFYEMAAFTHGVDVADYYYGPMAPTMKRIQSERGIVKQATRLAGGKLDADALAKHSATEESNRFTHSVVVTTWGPLYYTWSTFLDNPLRLPHDYQYRDGKPRDVVQPAVMFGQPAAATSLDSFAQWMTSPDNPRFTRVIANRLWKKVFGMGVIEPVDELTDDSTPANVPLMAHLEELMERMKYDMRGFLRVLLNTSAYQSAVTREEIMPGTLYHFTGPLLRRMTAEQMWDSLVTLINPAPDLINMEARDNLTRRLLGAKKLCDALEALPPEELEQWLIRAGSRNGEASKKLATIQMEIVAARNAKDAARADALLKESMPLRQIAQQAVNDEVLMPALLRLNQKINGTATLPKPDKPVTDVITQIPVAGYELARDNPTRKASDKAAYAVLHQLADYFGIPAKEKVYFPGQCFAFSRRWPRAADMVSPSIPGHYLRDFGQSDRETIENSSTDASIPQALILMNSELIPEILAPKSQVMLSIHRAAESTVKLENAYLALLSRKPTDMEKQRWAASGLNSIEDLVFALLNTQQFIFVQ